MLCRLRAGPATRAAACACPISKLCQGADWFCLSVMNLVQLYFSCLVCCVFPVCLSIFFSIVLIVVTCSCSWPLYRMFLTVFMCETTSVIQQELITWITRHRGGHNHQRCYYLDQAIRSSDFKSDLMQSANLRWVQISRRLPNNTC